MVLATHLGHWLNDTYPFAVRANYVAAVSVNPVSATITEDGVAVSLVHVDSVPRAFESKLR